VTFSMPKIFLRSSKVILLTPRAWAPVSTPLASSSFLDWKKSQNCLTLTD
jgi:hypothetical protein